MMIAGASLASSALASLTPLSTATTDADGGVPLNVLLNNVSSRQYIKVNTLQIEDTLGEQVSCSFTIVNPVTVPVVGDVVEVRYFSQTLFAGTIDRIRRSANNTLTERLFECTCTDWSQILVRNKIRRNFVNLPLVNIVDSLLDNELADEGLMMGRADRGTTIRLVDSRGGSAFDVLRDAASVTGQTFYVGFDKTIQFRVTSNDAAPIDFDTSTVERAALTMDRETYRNVQTVIVTGTPASESSTDANVSTQVRQNDDQIAERAAIEGGSGRYENIEEIKHPTSNASGDLALLGIGYAILRLATSGVPRQVLACRVRNYGFRAGQFATVDLSSLDASGTWLIQKVSMRDEDGRKLTHELELTQSSLQLRVYESWLNIVKGGLVTVQIPTALTNNLETFNVPGADTWTVPAGITTVEITCIGASAGGAGSARVSVWPNYPAGEFYRQQGAVGGDGGLGGRSVTIASVLPGQELAIMVGSAGTAGTNATDDYLDSWSYPVTATGVSGTDGTHTSVSLSGVVLCQANGGGTGTGGYAILNGYANSATAGALGNPGSGIGDAVTVGGGKVGGSGGTPGGGPPASAGVDPTDGEDGVVEIRW